jgi:hypothetical protein
MQMVVEVSIRKRLSTSERQYQREATRWKYCEMILMPEVNISVQFFVISALHQQPKGPLQMQHKRNETLNITK